MGALNPTLRPGDRVRVLNYSWLGVEQFVREADVVGTRVGGYDIDYGDGIKGTLLIDNPDDAWELVSVAPEPADTEPPAPARKATNPKDAIGVRKACTTTVPTPFIYGVGAAMLEGACKYGRHNYRVAGVRASVYVDALRRHVDAFWEGEDTDPDSGLPHVIKAAACLAVLFDSMLQGNWVDDRPPPAPPGWLAEFNARSAALLDKYPEPAEAYTAVKRDTDRAKPYRPEDVEVIFYGADDA